MAKAVAKPSTEVWIALSDGLSLLLSSHQSLPFAKRRLQQAMLAGAVPWRARWVTDEHNQAESDPGMNRATLRGDPAFWDLTRRHVSPAVRVLGKDGNTDFVLAGSVQEIAIGGVNWEESSARRRGTLGVYELAHGLVPKKNPGAHFAAIATRNG